MAFGQPTGPPASAKLLRQLEELLARAGHTDFRDARGPMGFTQRQANGKFTIAEAEEFIAALEAELDGEDAAPPKSETPARSKPTRAGSPPARAAGAAKKRPSMTRADVIREASSQSLAAELQRRGWVVLEP